jgi:hypothetical protein
MATLIDLILQTKEVFDTAKKSWDIGRFIGELIAPYLVEDFDERDVSESLGFYSDGKDYFAKNRVGETYKLVSGDLVPSNIPPAAALIAIYVKHAGTQYLRTQHFLYENRDGVWRVRYDSRTP